MPGSLGRYEHWGQSVNQVVLGAMNTRGKALQTLGVKHKSGGLGRYEPWGQSISQAVLGATNIRGKA